MNIVNNNAVISKNVSEQIARLQLIDDVFMTSFFNRDIESTQLVINIILNRDDITVKEVSTQRQIKNMQGRSVILDILATDNAGRRFNIELQRSNEGAVAKRARYNASLIDADITLPGDRYEDLSEVYVIFITEKDVFKDGEPIYHVERTVRENGKLFRDGSYIIYVNGENQDDTPLGRLMQDFNCSDPNKMNYDILAKRARLFKETEKGINAMGSGVIEEVLEEGKEIATRNIAIKMIKSGKLSEKDIAECTSLSDDEIKKLKNEIEALG